MYTATAAPVPRDKLCSAAAMAPSQRLLLLIPTTTYRTEDFVEAARALDVDLVIASDRPNVMAGEFPDHLLTLPFDDPEAAAREVRAYAARRPLDAVVPVDDATTVVASAVGEALGLRVNPLAAARATRDKRVMRELLARAGVSSPAFTTVRIDEDPAAAARRVPYPCVLKPRVLSASRGVIRADDPAAFVAAFARIRAILREPEVAALGEGTDGLVVEEFVPGAEVALEGLLEAGRLRPLALFDKPDPLDGPYFEETIYVTPSRLPDAALSDVERLVARGASAIGLTEGPVHAEVRVDLTASPPRLALVEVAARTIGGLCARTLRFGAGIALEEVVLRHAHGMELGDLDRAAGAAGVMMLPIPRAGVLEAVGGRDAALAVDGVVGLEITVPVGHAVVPLPEGDRDLGFLFAHADTPDAVEAALRAGAD